MKTKPGQLAWGLLKEIRPRQWIKNLAIFAGLIFSGQLDNPQAIVTSTEAFFLFSFATSAVYLLNDIFDIERDRLHPFKSKRPIAAGMIPVWLALVIALGLISATIPLSYQISPAFFLAILGYLLLQLLYSAYIKSVILLDVMAI